MPVLKKKKKILWTFLLISYYYYWPWKYILTPELDPL